MTKKYNTNNSSATVSCESLLAPANLKGTPPPVKGTRLQYLRNESCRSPRLLPRETERKQYTQKATDEVAFQQLRSTRAMIGKKTGAATNATSVEGSTPHDVVDSRGYPRSGG